MKKDRVYKMNYLKAMKNVLGLNPAFLQKNSSLKALQTYSIVNVLVLGLIYGSSAAFFSRFIMADLGLSSSANITKIIIAGIPVAFLVHAGASLFIWVFLKGAGGKADFLSAYFYIGTASVSFWLLAPILALFQAGQPSLPVMILASVLVLYAFFVNVKIIQMVFRLSSIRMAFATSITLIYISCFMYLWV